MSEEYFGKRVQNELKSRWGDPSPFTGDVAISFMSYYTAMETDVAPKSLRYSVGGFSFSSHLAWWFPKRKSSLTVEITLDELTNDAIIENTQTGFTIRQPYGMELAHLPLDNGETGIFVDKDWFKAEISDEFKSLNLVYTKGKNYKSSRKYNSFTLNPKRGLIGPNGGEDKGSYEAGGFRKSSQDGWSAVSAEVLDSHTLRVYLTDALYRENVDFQNLVLRLRFSESLEDCQVGFNDMPNYFGEIASREHTSKLQFQRSIDAAQ